MPANEQPWRNQKRMHLVFAISAAILLVSTIWMFMKDHQREWKPFQIKMRQIDLIMSDWRKLQYLTDQATATVKGIEDELRRVRGRGLDDELLGKFSEILEAGPQKYREGLPAGNTNLDSFNRLRDAIKDRSKVSADARAAQSLVHDQIETLTKDLVDLRQKQDGVQKEIAPLEAAAKADESKKPELDAKKAELATVEAAITQAETQLDDAKTSLEEKTSDRVAADTDVIGPRKELLDWMNLQVKRAKAQEDIALDVRKRANAALDEAKANLGLSVRDSRVELMSDQEEIISDLTADREKKNLDYQGRSSYRLDLEKIVKDLVEDEAKVEKELEDALANLGRIDTSIAERRSDYIEGIWLGKRWLEWPILDAFNSPLKIENKWSEDLEQDFNFSKVRRFDRCTTCHQAMEKTLPGSAVEPAYEKERMIYMTLKLPSGTEGAEEIAAAEEKVKAREGDDRPFDVQLFEVLFGVTLEAYGLVNRNDVTVSFVRPQRRSAEAKEVLAEEAQTKLDGDALLARMMQPRAWPTEDGRGDNLAVKAGMMVGDVVAEIEGDPVLGRDRALTRLLDAARDDKKSEIVVGLRRGLPHPYVTHPRLDLYVGSMSPHKLSDFACTICHDGQGSSTSFKWASHTPDSPEQRRRWMNQYGWFDNVHWIYPQYAKRFIESTCLKCHHDVTELAASERYPDPPAPRVTKGHHLISKYGCFGCHEVNGYDGPNKRVGPDLRLEPQFYAAAQQLMIDPGYAKLSARDREIAEILVQNPQRTALRRELYASLERDGEQETPVLSEETHAKIVPLLKDVEAPGSMRKSGPSLRMVKHKLESPFLYDWIINPRHFRPSTRMPVFFGNHNHLEKESKSKAQKYEPMEVHGMVEYLLRRSQNFDYIKPEKQATGDAVRGATQFQRQCLSCHSHGKYSEMAKFRNPDQLQQGPDLSGIADKLNSEIGRQWLYSWIKQPTKYHPRTVMPDLFLEQEEVKGAEGKVTIVDPVADIIAFLMEKGEGSRSWTPAEGTIVKLDDAQKKDLDALVLEHLKDAFYETEAEKYLIEGIPAELEASLKGIEKELLQGGSRSLEEKKILYVGRKSIAKYGCYGCHDIPGFEDAKPIGTALADWGKKESSKLAFEHIMQYMEHGHGHGHSAGAHGDHEKSDDGDEDEGVIGPREHLPEYYHQQIHGHNRIGFLYQKLTEPRAYDYHKTGLKKYNEWLKMPQFPFTHEEREEVMTFVLGLIADPPRDKYLYKPSPKQQAIQRGKRVLEKFNCAGCHIIEPEHWTIAYPKGHFGKQPEQSTFPFVLHKDSPEQLKKEGTPDHRSLVYSEVVGMPTLTDAGKVLMIDDLGDPVEGGLDYDPTKMEFSFDLWSPAIVDGSTYQVGRGGLRIPAAFVESRSSVWGGDLSRYLLPRVVRDEKKVNPNAKGTEAWAWLPPPLLGEGRKVQPDWLHSFLLNPTRIRPATVMRMPRFNMSSEEATDLVNFFAARDGVDFPYTYSPRQQMTHVEQANKAYKPNGSNRGRMDSAMRIVTDKNYCVTCHIIADFAPTGSDRAKAPDLSVVYQRLRPDYVRKWVAAPKGTLPYTAMPEVVPYKPGTPNDGGVAQKLFHGTSTEQLDGVVDLLMNFDKYTNQKTSILPLVKAAADEAAAEEAAKKKATAAGGAP